MIVALEGIPGAGKTTTAKLLADRMDNTKYVHESAADQPFLKDFYSNMERYKLETELCFVLLHYQYRDLTNEENGDTVILDYSPVKDLVFADVNLTGVDYEVFSTVYKRTSGSLPGAGCDGLPST
jgi:deoxyguanosine kinase